MNKLELVLVKYIWCNLLIFCPERTAERQRYLCDSIDVTDVFQTGENLVELLVSSAHVPTRFSRFQNYAYQVSGRNVSTSCLGSLAILFHLDVLCILGVLNSTLCALHLKSLQWTDSACAISHCYFKIQNLGIKVPHFWGKIEILSSHNILCRKFAAASETKCNFSAPSTLSGWRDSNFCVPFLTAVVHQTLCDYGGSLRVLSLHLLWSAAFLQWKVRLPLKSAPILYCATVNFAF